MPPATFIAAAAAPTFGTNPNTGNTMITCLTPSATKTGDTLLFVVPAIASGTGAVDVGQLPAGWSVIGSFISAGARIVTVLRRVATDAEPPSHAITVSGVTAAGGALLVYRGLDAGAALIAGAIADVSVSTNFPCPTQTLTTYSDLYLGIVFVQSASVVVTQPGGTTERFDAAEAPTGAPSEVEVFELLKEATGATGTQTATTAATQSGLAASVLLKTLPALPAAVIVPDIPGAIGLVTVGV